MEGSCNYAAVVKKCTKAVAREDKGWKEAKQKVDAAGKIVPQPKLNFKFEECTRLNFASFVLEYNVTLAGDKQKGKIEEGSKTRCQMGNKSSIG